MGNFYHIEFRTGTPRKYLSKNRGPGFRLSFAHIRQCHQEINMTSSHPRTTNVYHDMKTELAETFQQSKEILPQKYEDKLEWNQEYEEKMDSEFLEDYYEDETFSEKIF